MRLLGGWLAKIPEYELKLEIGRHVWQDAQAAEALRVRSGELRIPAEADRRPPVELQRWLDTLDQSETPLQFLVGVYRVAKPRLRSAMALHVAATDPVCDAPTLRTLRPIMAELSEQTSWAEAAIGALCAAEPEHVASRAGLAGTTGRAAGRVRRPACSRGRHKHARKLTPRCPPRRRRVRSACSSRRATRGSISI